MASRLLTWCADVEVVEICGDGAHISDGKLSPFCLFKKHVAIVVYVYHHN